VFNAMGGFEEKEAKEKVERIQCEQLWEVLIS